MKRPRLVLPDFVAEREVAVGCPFQPAMARRQVVLPEPEWPNSA
jgi:hypothetical protein